MLYNLNILEDNSRVRRNFIANSLMKYNIKIQIYCEKNYCNYNFDILYIYHFKIKKNREKRRKKEK